MAGALFSNVTAVLKEVYQGQIREQLNSDVLTLKRVQRSSGGISNTTGGKYVTFPIHTTRNSGIGSRGEMDPLPVPGKQGHAAAQVKLKYAYGGIQLTGQAISMSDTDTKAFAKVLDTEVSGLKRDVQKDMNRQIYGTHMGVIATAGSLSGQVITVDNARLFQTGMVVDIHQQATATIRQASRQVKSVDLATNKVTFEAGALTGTVSGDVIVRAGSFDNEIIGFEEIVKDTGTLYNIDPTTHDVWKSVVDSAMSNRAVSEGLMTQMADQIRVNGGETTVIFQSLGVRRAYANLLTQTRQTVNTQKFTGGFSGLAFTTDNGEIPVVADVDAPTNKQYFINEKTLTFYRDEEWHWLDRDGTMWKQVRDSNGDYDAWYARLVEYHELGCERRNSNGVITDLTEA